MVETRSDSSLHQGMAVRWRTVDTCHRYLVDYIRGIWQRLDVGMQGWEEGWEELRNCRAPRSQGLLTGECGSTGWSDAFGDQPLMVLLARQGAVLNLVLLNLCFTVVPLELKAGCCAGTNPQVLGGINLLKKKDITNITQDNVHLPCILNLNRLCSESPHLTLCLLFE